MGTFVDLTGRTFGRWTVLECSGRVEKGGENRAVGQSTWKCQCSCGTVKEKVLYGALTHGASQSCGCLRREMREGKSKHGLSKCSEMFIYQSMKTRCLNENHPSFRRYGGRGIKVCDRWLGEDGFLRFLEDMGRRPDGLTLDRKDNDGPYSPENCRWSTRKEQGANKGNNIVVDWNGKEMILSDICELEGVDKATVSFGMTRLGLDAAAAIERAKTLGTTPKSTDRPLTGTRVRNGVNWEDVDWSKSNAEIAGLKGVSSQAAGNQRKLRSTITRGVGKKTGPKPKAPEAAPTKSVVADPKPGPKVEIRPPVDMSAIFAKVPYKKP